MGTSTSWSNIDVLRLDATSTRIDSTLMGNIFSIDSCIKKEKVLRQKDTFVINETVITFLGVRYQGVNEFAIFLINNERWEIEYKPIYGLHIYSHELLKSITRNRILGWIY